MSISVVKAGLLDSIQDMGRYGYGKWGINAGGVMDAFAARVANMLVGNCSGEPLLEIHFPGPQILFEQNALVSICGADFSPMVNDEYIPLWKPVVVRRNTVLHFPKLNRGARCYLAVHGGFCVEQWLGSGGTHLRAGAGGWKGRPLKKGDELSFKENTVYFSGLLKEDRIVRALPWRADIKKTYHHAHEVFVLPGNEWDVLSLPSKSHFLENNFMIHPSSDRMGYHLKGLPLAMDHELELVSSGVEYGTIQLLPDRQLIVLMADHQTTGGYPRVAHVISAHLPKLAQLRPSECIRFIMTDMETAERLLAEQHRELQVLQRACLDHLNELVC